MNAVNAGPEIRQLTIRPFAADDRKSCLAIFDNNIPHRVKTERLPICVRS